MKSLRQMLATSSHYLAAELEVSEEFDVSCPGKGAALVDGGQMLEQHSCDFCGRSEGELEQHSDGSPKLELDLDGLWVCDNCRSRLVSIPVGQSDTALDKKVAALIGKSVGAICYTLNLPYEPPYQSIIDGASRIGYDQDLYMGAWSFVIQWPDGTTVWRAEDGRATAVVTPNGTVRIENG